MRDAQARTVYLKDYRVPDFLIDHTDLHVELFEDHSLVRSTLKIRRNPEAANQAALVLQGRALELLSVAIDGQALDSDAYQCSEESLEIAEVPAAFQLQCETRIHPETNTSLEGLYKSKRMFCTQCEAEGFRKITYYLDRPDVLSVFTTTIVADRARYPVLLSNGNCVGRGTVDGDDSRHWVRWEDPFRKPSYLFALVAGQLSSVRDVFTTCSGREVQLEIFVEEKDLDKCDFAMEALKRSMRWDEEVYGREYDLDIFMIVAVDDFNMGAMENKGLNIFNSSCVLANPATSTDFSFQRIEAIVAHEYFHNWSGNRVTCRDWFQLSLKEGFTVYRDSEFSADMGSRAVKRIEDVNLLRNVQFPEDAGPMAHSVRPESYMEISNFYTVTIYEKGSEVVRMQAELLGPERFREGTDRYFDTFDGQAVTTEDFIATMESVSGQDLTQFRRWYTQAGTPVLSIRASHDAEQGRYTLHVSQHCPPTPSQPEKAPFHIPLRMALLDAEGRELPLCLEGESDSSGGERVLHVREARQDFVFTGVTEKPVPSLLRGFSAPVKLDLDLSRDELMFLMSHDRDGFVRWDAGQQLALQVIDDLLQAQRAEQPLAVDPRLIEAFRRLLDSALNAPEVDKAMLAQQMLLPAESYIGDQYDTVEVEAVHQVRQTMRAELAQALRDELAAVYQATAPQGEYAFTADEVARRSLRNTVLNYLMMLDERTWTEACVSQYHSADNMTDRSAALRALVNHPSMARESVTAELLADFYETWKHEALVMEQWLSMQAGANVPDNLPRVQALMAHEVFDIKNPNKVRSVIGAFCHNNLVGFHQADGSGYSFLADQVLEIDRLNPQIASRLVTPLTRWQRHNPERQQMMKTQLQRLLEAPELSRDAYEVVSKSLG